ncbi:hypothetical protein B7R54_17230 [Subtercola boreus]|uniref:ParD-like antitoxin of type II toxin-antitoxin system n=1 Tax=Subtercola boreus TaxID=120213 RepID=A0A3E0VLB4_9MICO|nr:hypothetical protein [Subtercola boreus]RFA10752.1 hypothetical protein B7R54_17230 [Subtercola boreus]TQL55678.1 ParD-like antitoxin of type II ParDE toxin-antitoxin system [Subtercola boreus]
MKTMPTRIDGELFESAKAAGEVQSRSAAQQLDHWARIGREFESSPTVTHTAITEVLAGVSSYDDLRDSEQAVVRVAWNDRVAARIAELDFTDELLEAGLPWAEADADGNVIMVNHRPEHGGTAHANGSLPGAPAAASSAA